MDGVLVDFNRGLEEFNIINDQKFIHKPRSQWTPLQIKLDREVVDCMNTPGFFLNLPVMPGAFDLWKAAGSWPHVLTAWPQTTNDRARVANEKYSWIEKTFGTHPDTRFICCAREDKAKYASEEGFLWPSPNILVDDLEANCEAWTAAGGLAIFYKNSEQAVSDLRKTLNKLNEQYR